MEIAELVKTQRAYFRTGVTRSAQFRDYALRKLQTGLQDYADKIAEATAKDLGKDPLETYMCETGIVLDEISYARKHLRKWMKEKRVPTPLAQFPSRSFVSPEPYGVALILSPWNYPVQLSLSPLVGAIAAGNCAVLKPSAYAPESSRVIAELIKEIYPPEYCAVVEGGREENSALLEQKFDYIFFTGSVAVGRVAMQAAAKHLTPVTLELGGKDSLLEFPDEYPDVTKDND